MVMSELCRLNCQCFQASKAIAVNSNEHRVDKITDSRSVSGRS